MLICYPLSQYDNNVCSALKSNSWAKVVGHERFNKNGNSLCTETGVHSVLIHLFSPIFCPSIPGEISRCRDNSGEKLEKTKGD